MATYYANFDLATGNNDGTTAANAWQTLQRAVDGTGGTQPTAGDIVRCQGTDTLGANLDLDGLSGDGTTGMVRWIGMSDISAGTNDGTRVVIDGIDTYTCTATATNFWYFENFEFTQMSTSGIVSATSPDNWIFINCSFNNNGTHGIDSLQMQLSLFVRCAFYNNTEIGIYRGTTNRYILCSMHDNTLSGISAAASAVIIIGCLIYDNGDDGITDVDNETLIFNTVINGNADNGVSVAAVNRFVFLIGSRITNHSGAGDIGVECAGDLVIHGWNYYENNDGNNLQNNGIAIELTNNGASTDVEDQSDTNQGYTDLTDGAENLNLRSDATSRRIKVPIPTV